MSAHISSDQGIALRAENLAKIYPSAEPVHALRDINLTVRRGEFIAIMGSSGSGKSTLMNILGCLDQPSSGQYWLDGLLVSGADRRMLADIRNQKLGFVFQGFNLLPRTSAIENVMMPLLYDRARRVPNPREAAMAALRQVGLEGRMNHEPSQLSGGQQQRIAIARALVTQPSILLADEPTGNLDSRTSREVMRIFQDLNAAGITILLVTHEDDIASYTKRLIEVRDGRLVRDIPVPQELASGGLFERAGDLMSGTPAARARASEA
jgi:putative ABC transport system ATP-binding protein